MDGLVLDVMGILDLFGGEWVFVEWVVERFYCWGFIICVIVVDMLVVVWVYVCYGWFFWRWYLLIKEIIEVFVEDVDFLYVLLKYLEVGGSDVL